MNTIPIERLRELVRLDAGTGRIYWLKRANHKSPVTIGDECGCLNHLGYRQARIDGVTFLTHRAVFALQHGRWPDGMLDHANRDRADNRPTNLREASSSENSVNRPEPPNLSTGCLGVTYEKGAYRARIRLHGKKVNLGRFPDMASAKDAYAAASEKHHGQFRAKYGTDAELLAMTNQLIGSEES